MIPLPKNRVNRARRSNPVRKSSPATRSCSQPSTSPILAKLRLSMHPNRQFPLSMFLVKSEAYPALATAPRAECNRR